MTLRVPMSPLVAGEQALAPEVAHYLRRVRRLEVGDRFVAFDPEARLEADGVIVAGGVVLEGVRAATAVARRPVTVVQSLGKGAKLDGVVRDATELAATAIQPVLSARSVKRGGDVTRWRRIALEAARQCGRGDVPVVEPIRPYDEALAAFAAGEGQHLVLVPTGGRPLDAALLAGEAPIVFVVGPEGGLSADEIALAAQLGYQPATLGPFVMRTETACAAMLGAILAAR